MARRIDRRLVEDDADAGRSADGERPSPAVVQGGVGGGWCRRKGRCAVRLTVTASRAAAGVVGEPVEKHFDVAQIA